MCGRGTPRGLTMPVVWSLVVIVDKFMDSRWSGTDHHYCCPLRCQTGGGCTASNPYRPSGILKSRNASENKQRSPVNQRNGQSRFHHLKTQKASAMFHAADKKLIFMWVFMPPGPRRSCRKAAHLHELEGAWLASLVRQCRAADRVRTKSKGMVRGF